MSRQEIKEILHNLDFRPDFLDKEALSRTLSILINLVERLSEENEKLKIENQKLRDENNRLKGEQGKPNSVAIKEVVRARMSLLKKRESSDKARRKKSQKARSKRSELIEPKYVGSTPPNYPPMLNSKATSLSLCRKSSSQQTMSNIKKRSFIHPPRNAPT